MKKIEHIIYVAMDGEEFTSEAECLAHEKLLTIPAGVILMDENFERIISTDDIDTCYYAFLPTEQDVEWFRNVNKNYGITAIGDIFAGEHLWWDEDIAIWRSYEQLVKEAQENIQKFDSLTNK